MLGFLVFGLISPVFLAAGQQETLVMSTWEIGINATRIAWDMIGEGAELLDAVEEAISSSCETWDCGISVGPRGKIDESGKVSLDAMLMDGDDYSMGCVGNLRRVRTPIKVARAVMDYTTQTLLTGDQATEFAVEMGFEEESLVTPETEELHNNWISGNCQPNFRQNVSPDPEQNCGPYTPLNPDSSDRRSRVRREADDMIDHDTVCTIAIDQVRGDMQAVVGTSTNGLSFKVPGRVGDTPIPGSGGFADSEVGAAAATGNGDIMMRFLPSYQAVESMRQSRNVANRGYTRSFINRILKHYSDFNGAIMAANIDGKHAVDKVIARTFFDNDNPALATDGNVNTCYKSGIDVESKLAVVSNQLFSLTAVEIQGDIDSNMQLNVFASNNTDHETPSYGSCAGYTWNADTNRHMINCNRARVGNTAEVRFKSNTAGYSQVKICDFKIHVA